VARVSAAWSVYSAAVDAQPPRTCAARGRSPGVEVDDGPRRACFYDAQTCPLVHIGRVLHQPAASWLCRPSGL